MFLGTRAVSVVVVDMLVLMVVVFLTLMGILGIHSAVFTGCLTQLFSHFSQGY